MKSRFVELIELAHDWHNECRTVYEQQLRRERIHEIEPETINKLLDSYDKDMAKTVIAKKKYYYLDEGMSGAFMVERETGEIYRIKAYGQINRKKPCGNVSVLTGKHLRNMRWK